MKKKLSMMLLLSLDLLLAGQIGYAADRIVVSTEKAPKVIGPYSQPSGTATCSSCRA
jgi:hypothetical protein